VIGSFVVPIYLRLRNWPFWIVSIISFCVLFFIRVNALKFFVTPTLERAGGDDFTRLQISDQRDNTDGDDVS